MSGRDVLTLLLYLWIGITVAMVLMWLFRRRSGQPTTLGALPGDEDPPDDERSTGTQPDLRHGTVPDASPDSTGTVVLGATSRHWEHSPDEVGQPGSIGGADSHDGDEEVEDGVAGGRQSADEDHDDRHLVSTALGVGLSSTPRPSISESVIDLLAEVELPYDLAPLDLDSDGRRAVYVSPHPNPEDVGTEFADELVKLGYSIEPMGLDRAVARRGHDVLHMRIVPGAGAVVADDGETRRYRQASTTDTALEVWIDPGSDIAVRW